MHSTRPPVTRISRLARRAGGMAAADRTVPEETPIALSYGGTTHAVMMASPADLNHLVILPSATVSPSCGISTSIYASRS